MTTNSVELSAFVGDAYPRAYRTASLILRNPADAEDAVQEAFLRAWRFRAAVRDSESMGPWLYRVLVNTCYSKLRGSTPAGGGDEPLAAVADAGVSPEDAAVLADSAAVVREALLNLSDTLRIVVVLRYFAGLSEKEIAAAIRRRPGTVKSRLHEARRLLAADPRLAMFAEEAAQ